MRLTLATQCPRKCMLMNCFMLLYEIMKDVGCR